jgi:DMSO/TMAO reductase YedYZ molybdopterin-dependent catalytic subunit
MAARGETKKPADKSDPDLGRRLFLVSTTVLSLFLSLPSSLKAFFLRSFPVRTVEKDTFRFEPETGMIYGKEKKTREPFRLLLDGLVEKPVTLSYEDLKNLPRVKQVSDFHCVEGWSVQDVTWGGVRFAEIMKKVKITGEAKYAVFHSLGTTSSKPAGQEHYVESFPLTELLDPKTECLLALTQDGKPLSHDHGAPCRVIAPFDLAYKNIKYVCRVEFSKYQKAGWWTLANPYYPVEAPVPAERLRKKQGL